MIPIAIGVLILAMASIFVTQTNNFTSKVSTKKEVKSLINVPPGPTEISLETPSPSPTPKEKLAKTPQPSPTTSTPTVNNSAPIQYPGSIRVDNNVYTSTDDPDTITGWYKERIKAMNMNVKNFVSTKTNGNVLNKLEGVSGKSSIKVEITKSSDNSIVKIVIEITVELL